MSYDDWKLATPPDYDEQGEPVIEGALALDDEPVINEELSGYVADPAAEVSCAACGASYVQAAPSWPARCASCGSAAVEADPVPLHMGITGRRTTLAAAARRVAPLAMLAMAPYRRPRAY